MIHPAWHFTQYTTYGVLQARLLAWVAISSSGGPRFVGTLHYDPSVLVVLHGVAHSFTELCKPLCHDKVVIHEGDMLARRV